uniref:MYND-type domain-containing protein n=1 Tax=Plectus sambesii TaxID=2011161 RepID=A0A914W756_9BILA
MATTSADDGGGRPLFEEWPFAYVVKSSHIQNVGDESQYLPERALQRCSRCGLARYCNRNCQTSAFKDHKEECKLLARTNGFVPDTTSRLMARIIFKRNAEYQPDARLPEQLHKRRFQDLMNHADDILKDPIRSEQFKDCCKALEIFFGSEKCPPTNDLLDVFGKIITNAYGINVNGLDMAYGLYVGASVLDHSCNPDATYTFDGPKIAIHPLKAGLRAVSPYDDKEMRSIRCLHCSSGAALLDDDEKAATCQICGKANDAADAVALMNEIKAYLCSVRQEPEIKCSLLISRARQLLSDINVYMWHLNVQLQNIWVDAGRNDEAFVCCEQSLIVRRRFMNPNDELLLNQLTNAANFMMRNPSRAKECIPLLTEAQKGYSFTFGANYGPAQECRRLLDIVQNRSKYKKWLSE